MASPEEALYPYSNVGAVEFTFEDDAGDWLLDQHGGGWLNVVIDTTAAGGDLQWAVQNLYLTYYDVDYLLGSTPSVQFSLGLDNKTPIEELEAAVFLSSEALEEQPEAKKLDTYPVSLTPYLVGGGVFGDLDRGSADSDIPLTIGCFVGPAVEPVRVARIKIPVNEVAKINEDHCMCDRGAIARSISYLGKVCNFTTDDPQTIYDDVVKAMKNIAANNKTQDQKLLEAKNTYCMQKGLNITSEIVTPTGWQGATGSWKDITEKVKDALDAGCDVEVQIAWNATSGHMGMVTSVANFPDGSTTIGYVDDPTQGDRKAANNHAIISTDNTGKFKNGTNSSVCGFMIECCVPEPEPEPLDHFKCYMAEDICPKPIKEMYLEDQFGAVNATPHGHRAFCNPVEKTVAGCVTKIKNPDHHLTLYELDCKEETWFVKVKNQFGTQNLTVKGPVGLAVPTQKKAPKYHEPPVGLDHFLLYLVIEGPDVKVTVNLTDQFHDEPNVSVNKTAYFANPVLKIDDEGNVTKIENPEAHLVFYDIVGEPFKTKVQIYNQFGNQTLKVHSPIFLIVPSEKLYYEPYEGPDL